MMQEESFAVKYITVNTCFVYLPEHWLRKLSSRPNVMKVQHNDVNYYLSWYTRPSPDNSRLCLSATFARTLNIKEGDEVFVSCAEEAPPLTSLVVAPKSSHDREILELQSENIQSNLLNQITIVAKDQTIVAWVSKFLSVALIVQTLNPQFKYGRLEENTEIHVSNALTNETSSSVPKSGGILDNVPAALRSYNNSPGRVYQVRPLPAELSRGQPFKVFVNRSQMIEGTAGLCRLRKVREDHQLVKTGGIGFLKRQDHSYEFVVQLCAVEDLLNTSPILSNTDHFTCFPRHPGIYMSEGLLESLRLKVSGKVILEPMNEQQSNKCTCIEISSPGNSVTEIIFRDYLNRGSKQEKLLLNSSASVRLDDGSQCQVKLMPENCTYALFDEAAAWKVDVVVKDAANVDERRFDEVQEDDCEAVRNIVIDVLDAIITECIDALTLSLGLHHVELFEYDRENILICGSTGSGKTTVYKWLSKILKEPPYFVHTLIIDCRSLKGKKVEVIQKSLATVISASVYYQPSVLFFDDIESITSAGSNTDENTPDSMNAARITDAIFSLISEYQASHYISVVATCTDISKVGKKLRETRGTHFFKTVLKIPNLEKDDRIKILRSSLEDKLYLAKEIDWDHYGNKTEGWVAQDLVVLADKAAFAAWKRHVKEKSQGSVMLRDADLSDTLSRCTPVSLQGVSLYKGAGHLWSDIGGLHAVKHTLVELLNWPLRYPGVFKRAPVRLQSGILLYGMPGTGKTMLAGAIAQECGLNLISVKGPELLSKYIGASEEAVRNIFEKAHKAKPCVLFFDEFDSLAPRRGHDSTGVTDRVVNQLLTHLDGIEGREGVAVIAASSRPDLLDPALLRPGRLDKSLLCPLPDENDREEILNATCRMHEISTENLDLHAVACLTPGFTGADLNAVIMQARLNIIEEAMGNGQNDDYKNVTQKHLVESVNSTKPSLSTSEKEKYERIYAKFSKCENYSMYEFKNQRATLA